VAHDQVVTSQLDTSTTGSPIRTGSPVNLATVLAGAGLALAPLALLAGIAVTTLRAAPTPAGPAPAGPPSSAEVLATQR